MRKTSKYARNKAKRTPALSNHFAVKLQDHTAYSETSLLGALPTMTLAKKTLKTVWDAYHRVDNRNSPGDQQTDFELLAHAVVIAQLRTYDIGGQQAQEVLNQLNDAVGVLDEIKRTWHSEREWRMSGECAVTLRNALDIYEQILLSSTPFEMHEAQTKRLDWFKNVYAKGN
jgi:hypothetical protein